MQLPKKLKIRYKINKKIILVVTISLFVVAAINQVRAQSATRTVTVTPPTVSVKGDPGYYTEGTMGVINESDSPITFRAEMHDFIVEDTIGTPEILPPNTLMKTYSAASWMAVSPQVFTIAPKQRQNLNYFIQIPGNAKPGGHYAAVVFNPAIETPPGENTGALVTGQIGTLFSIAVNGPIKESATVTKFTTNGLQEYGPVNIFTQIKNQGDLHIRPAGYITVSNILGQKAVLPLSQYNIFPQAARDYQNKFGGKIMFGRFKAELLASYGTSNNLPLTATMYFWVMPWRIIIVIILILLAAILGYVYFDKKGKFRKPEAEKPAQTPTQ
jgi:hypothetical protein